MFKADRPWPNRRLKVAAIIGHATPQSVRLWVRTGRPGPFSVWIYRRASEEAGQALHELLNAVPLASSDLDSLAAIEQQKDFEIDDYAADTTRVIDIQALSPDTRHGYLLYDREDQRAILGHNRLRSFRSPPPDDARRAFQFALFSCNLPYAVNGLFKKRTDVSNIDMWDFLAATLTRHRGYWGFEGVQRVFDRFPTYMIWDDHEIVDGWGSHYFEGGGASERDGLRRMLPDLEARGLDYEDGMELVRRMVGAARCTYAEYQHSHNPPTEEEQFDYAFRQGGCGFYVLDGRGHRDLARDEYRILGREQFGDEIARRHGRQQPSGIGHDLPVLRTAGA